MKRHSFSLVLILMFSIFSINTNAQTEAKSAEVKPAVMKTYLIERNIPGAGSLTGPDLKGISQKSCSVLKEMGPQIEWIQSYVTGDKIFCIYKAENEQLLREHAKKGGFPINNVTEIANVISPETAK